MQNIYKVEKETFLHNTMQNKVTYNIPTHHQSIGGVQNHFGDLQ